jgi:hypothetical protein
MSIAIATGGGRIGDLPFDAVDLRDGAIQPYLIASS